jgi:hypothetical protein
MFSPEIATGTRACIGMPQASCERAFEEADVQARDRGTVVVAIVVRCTTICSEASGEAERTVRYADGISEQSGFGWMSAGPAPGGQPIEPAPEPEPSLPVAPTCVDLDPEMCLVRALESAGTLEPGSGEAVSIVVRCTPGPCTPTNGDGETTITFADGQVTTVGWSYRGGP